MNKGKIKKITYDISSHITDFYSDLLSESIPVCEYNNKDLKLEIQIDGVFIPVVTYDKDKLIGEKERVRIDGREVKHVLVKLPYESKGFHFAKIIPVEDIDVFFDEFRKILILKGYDNNTKIFIIADGAKWIHKRLDEFFDKNQFNFIIDFYHLSEYIHEAVQSLPDKYHYLLKTWKSEAKKGNAEEIILNQIKKLNLSDESVEVIRKLKNGNTKKVNLIKILYQYIENRPGQFNYTFFKENKMPIGSGRIESANKILIKKRMNIPFGWEIKNSNLMLALLTMNHNKHWNKFWKYYNQKSKYEIQNIENITYKGVA